MIDQAAVKHNSEAAILAAGGQVWDDLPPIAIDDLAVRDAATVGKRALVLHGLVNLCFDAPQEAVSGWLKDNGLIDQLTPREHGWLDGSGPLPEEFQGRLRWTIQSLWAMAWVCGFVETLAPTQPVSDRLAGFFPDLQRNERAAAFAAKVRMRSIEQLYATLDLLYRAHWYARDCRLVGRYEPRFNEGILHFRRLTLEWVLHPAAAWDEIDF